MKGKLCLVTGGAGFIGQSLTRRLLNMGVCVTVVDCSEYVPFAPIDITGAHYMQMDVRDSKLMNKWASDFDYIFHFGAPCSVVQFNRDPANSILNTIQGFRNVATLADEHNAKLIFPSSGNVYGNIKSPMKETDKPEPNNAYAACKLLCEDEAGEWCFDSVGLRIFAGYGQGEQQKGDLASVVTLFLNDIQAGRPITVFGDGEQRRDFIYIDDIVDAVISAAERDVSPIINVGIGTSYSFNELITTLLVELNVNSDRNVKYVGKPSSYVENTCADTTRMEKELGVYPLLLHEGIRCYLESGLP